MSIYAISDLHLSFSEDKPMYIFGENWKGHEEKIRKDWIKKIKNEDLVLLPGDFSWSMYLEETVKDFEYLSSLPGKKIILKGNHDYWWTTLARMRKFLKENKFSNIDFIHNNSYEYEGYIICGTRGWALTDTDNGKKMIKRENARLELSIKEGIEKFGEDKEIIVCMHYPPISKENINTEFMQTMKKYNVKKCIYGHLHGKAHKDAIEGIINNIEFKMVSCDYTNFEIIHII